MPIIYINNDDIRLNSSSSDKVVVTGSLGIGTTAPIATLDITKVTPAVTTFVPYLQLSQRGTVANSKTGISFRNTEYNWDMGKISTERQGAASSFDFVFYSALNGVDYERMRITNSGNVGIGTTSPSGKFEVGGGSGSSGVQSYFSTSAGWSAPAAGNTSLPSGAKIVLWNDTGGNQQKASIGMDGSADIWFNNAGGQSGAGFTFYTGNGASASPEARLKITKDGAVGIGTTSPEAKLHIAGGDVLISNGQYYGIESTTGGNYKIAGLTTGNVVVVGAIDYTSAGTIFAGGDNVSFTTGGVGGSTRIKIDSSGNVGIGTTSPGYLLDVNGSMRATTMAIRSGGFGSAFNSYTQHALGQLTIQSGLGGLGEGGAADHFLFRAPDLYEVTTTQGGAYSDVTSTYADTYKNLFTGQKIGVNVANASIYSLRMTWNNIGYKWFDTLYVPCSFQGNSMDVTIEKYDGTNWVTVATRTGFVGWEGRNVYINAWNNATHSQKLRITFDINWNTSNYAQFYRIAYYGGYPAGSEVRLFTWDYGRNTFFNAGNVGIGTTSPLGKLQVNEYTVASQGNQGVHGELSVFANSGDESLFLGIKNAAYPDRGWAFNPVTNGVNSNLQIKEHGLSSVRMTIASGGNVGIGTTSPGSPLDVLGKVSINSDGTLNWGNAKDYGRLTWDTGKAIVRGESGKALSLGANGTQDYLYINTSGNVGIGTTSPTAKLHVSGTGEFTNTLAISKGASDTIQQGSSVYLIGGSGASYTQLQQGVGRFTIWGFDGSGWGEKLTINNTSGNVGIGTTSPSVKLHTVGDGLFYSDTNTNLTINSNGGVATLTLTNGAGSQVIYGGVGGSNNMDFYTGSTFRMRIDSSGNVGIGTTSPNGLFEVFQAGTGRTRGDLLVDSANRYTTVGRLSSTTSDNSSFKVIDRLNRAYFDVNTSTKYISFNPEIGDITMQIASGYGFKVNTSQFVVSATNGNVGIGTTTPAQKLEVSFAASTFGARFTRNDNAGSSLIEFANNTGVKNIIGYNAGVDGYTVGTSSSTNLTIKGNGNVGIGTTSPGNKLVSEISAPGYSIVGQHSSGGQVGFYNSTADNGVGTVNNYPLNLFTNNSAPQVTLTTGGSVGIGTTSPNVYSFPGGKLLALSDTSTYSVLVLASGGGNSGGISMGNQTIRRAAIDHLDGSNLAFYTNGTNSGTTVSERMRITSAGNVGIGTTAPDSKFHVEDINPEVRITGTGGTSFPRILWEYPVSATQASRWALTSGASGNTFYLYNYTQSKKVFQVDGTASHITLNHDAAGTTQIGTSTTQTAYQLYVATNVGQTGAIEASGSVKITSGALGVNIAASATAGRIDASNDIVAYSTSDKRLKENIKPIENALDKVKSLTGVEFDWIEETKHVHGYEGHDVGVIAQEVQEVLPEAIRTNDSGYLSVRYEKMIALLVEANKELAARVELLEQKLKQ